MSGKHGARTLLGDLTRLLDAGDVTSCISTLENAIGTSPLAFSFVTLAVEAPMSVRDIVMLAMRLYASVGKMDKIRGVFVAALRDLTRLTSPSILFPTLINTQIFNTYLEILTIRKQYDAEEVKVLLEEMKRRDIEPNSLTYHYLIEIHVRAGYDPTGLWQEMLKKRSGDDSVSSLASSYTPLRPAVPNGDGGAMDNGPTSTAQQALSGILPNPATLQTLLHRLVPVVHHLKSRDSTILPSAGAAQLTVEVTSAALCYPSGGFSASAAGPSAPTSASLLSSTFSPVVDKKQMVDLVEQWLQSTPASTLTSSAEGESVPKMEAPNAPSSTVPFYPPEYILWVMMELEVRCVLEKANFVQFIQKRHVVQLLLHCAKCGDAKTFSQAVALMDRHLIRKTADTGALGVWCFSKALCIEAAIDMIMWMAYKGYLEHPSTSPFFQRYTMVDTLRYTMDRHFLMHFVDALSTPELVDRALKYLKHIQDQPAFPEEEKANLGDTMRSPRKLGPQVSAHILDLLVLAYAKISHEREAMDLLQSYETVWHVTARTNSLNALLMGLQLSLNRRKSSGGGGGGGAALHHRDVFDAVTKHNTSPVIPNSLTYKLLIRHAVASDNIDEAVEYLQMVAEAASSVSALRVEVEMILPILERAGRAGDVDTVNLLSQFALDCDVGIDPGVLQNVISNLAHAGYTADVLRGHMPLHEALRSRSKVARQRSRASIKL